MTSQGCGFFLLFTSDSVVTAGLPLLQKRAKSMSKTLPLFRQYTPYDIDIVKTATKYGLYLIGGTAIDLLCRYYSIPFWRNRSDNDLDFWTAYNNGHKDKFIRHIKSTLDFVAKENSDYMQSLESFTIHTDTDILIDYDLNNCKFCYTINNIKVMSPIYLFASKFDRYLNCNNVHRKTTDFKDLQTLLLLIERTNGFDELENHLSALNYDQTAENTLNSIIASMI